MAGSVPNGHYANGTNGIISNGANGTTSSVNEAHKSNGVNGHCGEEDDYVETLIIGAGPVRPPPFPLRPHADNSPRPDWAPLFDATN